ncbi:MAG: sulfotransferase family 2 domain-containing protein [Waterburya sp.]
MIVADQKKILYVHIYKTGGTSINHLLMPYITENYRSKNSRTEGNNWQRTWHVDNKMHSKFSDALHIIDNLNINLEEYFKFVFVRNPYSWILSVWNNFFRSPTGNTKMNFKNYWMIQLGKVIDSKLFIIGPYAQYFYKAYPNGGFKNFVIFIDQMITNNPKMARKFWGCYDQYSFIENDRNIQFDFIGKFEKIESDLKIIAQIIEPNKILDIPHTTHGSSHNKQDRENYLKYYDQESIEIINRIFARDFKAFNYQPILNLSQHAYFDGRD